MLGKGSYTEHDAIAVNGNRNGFSVHGSESDRNGNPFGNRNDNLVGKLFFDPDLFKIGRAHV